MRILLLIMLIPFSGIYSQAQTNLDSLYIVWQDETQPDSTRTKAYADYIKNGFLFSNPDSASIQSDELIIFSKDRNDLKGQYRACNIKGILYGMRGEYSKALDFFTQSINIAQQMGNHAAKASPLGNIGNTYIAQGNYPKALDYFNQCLKIQRQIDNQRGVAQMLNNIGLIYDNQGDYSNAMDYYSQCIKIHEELNEQSGMAKALYNVGNIHLTQSNYSEALDYHKRSLEISEQMGDQGVVALSLAGLARIYQQQGYNDKAMDVHSQSLMIFEKLGDQPRLAGELSSIGYIYSINGDYLKALDYCEKSYEIALSVGVLAQQKGACQCLYNTYKAMGKGNEALEFLEKVNVINDSLNAEETTRKLQQMEFAKVVLQDSIAKAEEARLVEASHQEEMRQGEKTRNILGSVGGLVLILAGGLYGRVRYIRKSKAVLQTEKDRSDNLLLNILPADIAAELKEKGKADARDFDMVSILFTDFKGFTEASAKLSAQDLVAEINTCFEAFDGIMSKYKIEKIKTIGDAYMAAGGLPVPEEDSVKNTVLAALEMQSFISNRKAEMDASGKPAFEMRVGIHTGPVVAGIVGVKKFQYDIWGDTVNTASRVESAGEVGKVNISQATYELLKSDSHFTFESRGKIEAKGKGEMHMYFVSIA